ncbi:MAG TPA: hypothetical protein VFW44_21710 [Bryobacteraceae bacterium]|nr:hypothetical protein [Bryobacteraceae bacterium]
MAKVAGAIDSAVRLLETIIQVAPIDQNVVRPLETRLASIQLDVNAMLTQLAKSAK